MILSNVVIMHRCVPLYEKFALVLKIGDRCCLIALKMGLHSRYFGIAFNMPRGLRSFGFLGSFVAFLAIDR